MEQFFRLANWWWWSWVTIAFLLVMTSGFGMAFMDGAEPDPRTYPAKFLVLGILAAGIGFPGWVLMMGRYAGFFEKRS